MVSRGATDIRAIFNIKIFTMKALKNSIVLQAINLGFDFESMESNQSLLDNLKDFFYDNADKLQQVEHECEVIDNRGSQHVSFEDYWCDGEIVKKSDHWHLPADTKIFHSNFIKEENGVVKNVRLFYYVGETDYNTNTPTSEKWVVRDREAGNIIEEFESKGEAEAKLKDFENVDKLEGTFTENFYEVAKL